MSKLDKFKEIFAIGSGIAKPFVPGGVGSVFDLVNKGLDAKGNTGNADEIKTLNQKVADLEEENHVQGEAILALNERLKKLEAK